MVFELWNPIVRQSLASAKTPGKRSRSSLTDRTTAAVWPSEAYWTHLMSSVTSRIPNRQFTSLYDKTKWPRTHRSMLPINHHPIVPGRTDDPGQLGSPEKQPIPETRST